MNHQNYLDALRVRADRLLLALCVLALLTGVGIAMGNGTWPTVLLVALPTVIAMGALTRLMPGAALTRMAMAVATMILSAALIHQTRGMLEMHFAIFVLLAALVYYRDWRVLVLAAAVIAVHHALFGWLQLRGVEVWAYPDGYYSFGILLIHAAFVVAETAFLVVMARGLEDDATRLGAAGNTLRAAAERLAVGDLGPARALGTAPAGSAAWALGAAARSLSERLEEVSLLVEAQAAGDFARRVDASGTEGELAHVIAAVNQGAQRSEVLITEVADSVEALARGELPKIDSDQMSGEYRRLLRSLQHTVDVFSLFQARQSEAVRAFIGGDTRQSLPLDGLQGFQLELGRQINGLFSEMAELVADFDRFTTALGKGDLTVRLGERGGGDFARLRKDSETAMRSLQALVGELRAASRDIHGASESLNQGTEDLSSRIQSQAASLEQSAAAMEQLTSTVQQNAQSANEARTLADGATRVAEEGGSVVQQVVRTMGQISEASQRIADIIGVIDGIAFQTNILALNAAVEAARAGEQGRGFAVVASEVRALAQRSADAAKEIKALIENSGERVRSGSELVSRAGDTMGGVVDSVRRVSALIAEISAASAEQARGIAEVSRAVGDMETSTQASTEVVQGTASQGALLAGHAERLERSAGRFRTA
ncbi:methyl-accepting chemotaxis protein [Pseudomarimonas salicorniae]|uniref:Methyl-accepting chemotaxis protein n=1 Tax=Pseudomarimonas salicorniae TaxID=2933270 RepID=A0ABT0GNA4_9GAMM|nr:methyl-accepting chemotaxis protein [Lysobacter sp. CAU 1642]MCK7595482.1 methyl-accepting chemotaxis protein [Lysobacter sp. CAU 1642]